MNDDKKTYELCYLLTLPEAEEEILRLCGQYEGEVLYRTQISELKLAYPIRKQQSALFGFLQFAAMPENVPKIKKDLLLNPKVLRSIIMKLSPKKVFERAKEEAETAQKIERPVRLAEPKPAKPQVLTNEALEEKLEEILK